MVNARSRAGGRSLRAVSVQRSPGRVQMRDFVPLGDVEFRIRLADVVPRHGTHAGAGELLSHKERFLSLAEQHEATMLKTFMISAAVSALMVSGALAQADKPADSAKFISQQSQDQWVFSKFKGTDVLGPDNAHIGNVNDMLFDKQGKIVGLIVGVGGFLGIGEKNVAIDMSAFQPVPYDTGSSTSGAGTASRNDDPTMVKLKVSWTKDQLKNAPDFQYYKAPSRTSSGGGAPTTGMAPRPTAPTAPPAGR
jgi:hypothetical protein